MGRQAASSTLKTIGEGDHEGLRIFRVDSPTASLPAIAMVR